METLFDLCPFDALGLVGRSVCPFAKHTSRHWRGMIFSCCELILLLGNVLQDRSFIISWSRFCPKNHLSSTQCFRSSVLFAVYTISQLNQTVSFRSWGSNRPDVSHSIPQIRQLPGFLGHWFHEADPSFDLILSQPLSWRNTKCRCERLALIFLVNRREERMEIHQKVDQ